MQTLNISLGGSLKFLSQDSFHAKRTGETRADLNHSVQVVSKDSIMFQVFGSEEVFVNGVHLVQIEDIAPSLKSTLIAEDGGIEALEHRDHSCMIGVQFHPELRANFDPVFSKLFEIFFSKVKQVGIR